MSFVVLLMSQMAGKITHIEGLRQTLHLMEHGKGVERDFAERLGERRLFRFACLGAVAPDVFYFYHIFERKKNALGLAWGNRAHHSRVFEFVAHLLDFVRDAEDENVRDKCLAFTVGYLCHCGVDIVTHPYIFYITGDPFSEDREEAWEAQSHHLRVEFALDSYLMHHRWGMGPQRYDFLHYVEGTHDADDDDQLDGDIRRMWVRALRETFLEDFDEEYPGEPDIVRPGDLINDAYRGFLRFCSWTDARSWIIRMILHLIDLLTFRKLRVRWLILPQPRRVSPRLHNERRTEWKYPADPERRSTESFMDLVHRAAEFSAELVGDGLAVAAGELKRKDFLKKYSGYNLDTGLRSDSLEMQAFEPVRDV